MLFIKIQQVIHGYECQQKTHGDMGYALRPIYMYP